MKTVKSCKRCGNLFTTESPYVKNCCKREKVMAKVKCLFCEVEFETEKKTHYLMPKFCKECAKARVWGNRESSRMRAKKVGKDLKVFLAEYYNY